MNKKPNLIPRLMQTIRPYWFMGSLGIFGTVLYSVLDASFVYLLQPLMDEGFIARNKEFIQWVPFLTLGAFLLRGLTSLISSYFMSSVARMVVMVFRQRLFEQFLRLPAYVYDRSSSGQLLSRLLYDTEQVAQVSMDALTTLVQSFCLVVGLFIVMFMISVPLTLIYLITAPAIALLVKVTNKKIRKTSLEVQKTMRNVTEIAEEVIEGYRVVRISGAEMYEKEKFFKASEQSRKQDMRIILVKALNVSGVQLVAAVGISMIIYFAINPNSVTVLSAGGFSAILAAMLAMLKPLKNLTTVNGTIQRGLAGAQSVFEMLDSEIEQNQGKIVFEKCQGHINFENICFSYPNTNSTVLKDINLVISPGEIVALVGRSGSGKSTLANLIPRFYEPTQGKITLDGIPLNNLDLRSLRSKISIVTQQVTLFNDSIFNNIIYSKSGYQNKQKLMDALKRSHSFEFIQQLPKGIDTLIGENGVLLSGGQRQRIAIARAIYKDAPILILDEATSSLDTESEYYIQQALQEVMQNRTTLIIAHRLSTIKKADKIVVLDDGRIVEVGTHEQLLSQNGFYSLLYSVQFNSKNIESK